MVEGTITIDKSDPDYAALKATKDHLVALGVLRGDGNAAILVMAVPDTNQDLWPTMVTVATSAHLT